ncbi:MAG: hypothetical protein VX438_06325 [Planctomycetota bacterium]|nr:hypothetical protein [Planctomycetota bacterium]
MKNVLKHRVSRSAASLLAAVILLISSCKKSAEIDETQKTTESAVAQGKLEKNPDPIQTEESNRSQDKTLMEKTSSVIKNATDSSLEAANHAGGWIKDTVDSSLESSRQATLGVGKSIQGIFQLAKEQGTTAAGNVVDFVKEDIAKLGTWEYTARTVTNEDPLEVVEILNCLGKEKWDCFWVDKQGSQTTLYFKKPSRSYTRSIPFKDLIRYLPELQAGGTE